MTRPVTPPPADFNFAQHLIASNHAQGRHQTRLLATLRGRGQQRQIAGAGYREENDDSTSECRVI